MKTAILLLGNFGVGKSSIIDYPVLEKEDIFCRIFDNVWVLGKHICGADSLSGYLKKEVYRKIQDNTDKNLVLAGVYYASFTDIERLHQNFKVVCIFLDTSFENNSERIGKRGRTINVASYTEKNLALVRLLRKSKHYAKRYIVDNNRQLNEVKQEVKRIIENETS